MKIILNCFNCGESDFEWDADFNSEDLGYMEGGLATFYTCSNCGADLLTVSFPAEEDEEE